MSDVDLLKSIGLDEKKAAETTRNKDLTATLKTIITEAGAGNGCDKSAGSVLYTIATKYPANAIKHRPMLARLAVAKEVTNTNIQAALEYLKKLGSADINMEAFKSECGVGVHVTKEQITATVAELFKEKHDEIVSKRYRINVGLLLTALRANPATKWAEGKLVAEEVDAQLKALLGPKTAEDEKPVEKKKAEPKPQPEKPKEGEAKDAATAAADDVELPPQESIRFPDPKENIQNDPKILEEHLKRTGGRVYTRFPPEPNGYLHIGHAKAMHLSFGYAKKNGGVCYLRFDDTNPEKEDMEYFNAIIDNVKWMGWEPWKITYSSHNFPKLHELAVELIKRGLAYVCHENKDQMKEGRKNCRPSPYRNRSVEENLRLFEDMRKGKFAEGECCLRMKGDMNSLNPNMRDLVAYRIKYVPHPISGDEWCIYPSYDFTHCLVDSIEDITHSLCTLEFETRREPYNWLVDVLGLYRPVVWEYSRLNLTNTVLSKRKLIFLVKQGLVRGWDDPRMSTIMGYRRKGFPASAINTFCEKIGVTRAPNLISIGLLEHFCRLELDPKVPRAMVVLSPLKVVITNLNETLTCTVNTHPYEKMGTHTVPLTNVVYIERTDFREKDEKGYYGLAPNKEVMLKYAYNIKCTEVIKDEAGNVTELRATMDKTNATKVKGVLHWVAESKEHGSPIKAEIRLYEHLFKSECPNDLGDDWLNDLNPDSLKVIPEALCDVSLKGVKVEDKFQFERQGYFVVDKDTTPDHLVFNRTVSLKESKAKKVVATPTTNKPKTTA